MNKKLHVLLILAVLLATTLAACSGHSGRSHGSRNAINNETNTDVYTYDLPENANQITLDLAFGASQGAFSWRVTDPQGNIVMEDSLAGPGDYKKTTQLERIPGRWTLEVEMKQASGNYDIEWSSR